ncbi:hypothetical protein DRE_05426 [Drechslerella stenobrocha 248]|uniref:Cytosolic endo-beta-N-acetylglucosaminidase TIM barrel domain-containing protein n=1 Tax=Drechslerella stenobrocha 248 TaxID=1043628 RepID=W7I065_9PEZI|nr:hypothetical protein DRE_05426 [Drechslerella stenobrocha 248]
MATTDNDPSASRSQSRGREVHRPTTPLRESSRSRDSVSRFRSSHEVITPIESITPFFAELEDAMSILHDNLMQLQQIHENINKFNENFSAMMYGMEINAFCVDFPEAPFPESFKREAEAAKEAERLAASQPAPIAKVESEAEMTFMTNDTFVEQPVTPAARNPKTPMRRGQTTGRGGGGTGHGASRGGGSGGTGRGGASRCQGSSSCLLCDNLLLRNTTVCSSSPVPCALTNLYPMKYFDDLASVRHWQPDTSNEAEASNIANVPLQERPIVEERDPFKLLVCHDFKGGYLPYEDSQGTFSDEAVYTLEYLHLVTTFVYFSHHRVTIPPAPWINLMHKNGVRILGTFIVEPGNTAGFDDLLERGPDGQFVFVERLVDIAAHYGFDGWLLNFEEHFPDEKFRLKDTIRFIEDLRNGCDRRVKGSEVVWYDSLTIYNRVAYANGLSPANAPFFSVSSAIFTNYRWNPLAQLLTTAALSKALHRSHDVYMGIDVFGRGTFGGGGWGVGTALSVIRPADLSAAIFAPGWTFENFDGVRFEERNRKFWIDNDAADADLVCRPVAEFAPAWEAGTERFFYTDFNRGHGSKWFQDGREISSKPWVHVGAQSVLPSFYPVDTDRLVWGFESQLAYSGGNSIRVVRGRVVGSGSAISLCRLYKLNMDYKPDLRLSFSYMLDIAQKGRVGLYFILKRFNGVTERHEVGLPVQQEGWGFKTVTLDFGKTDEESFGMKVVELGVTYIDSDPIAEGADNKTVLRLGHICLSGLVERKLPGIDKVAISLLPSGKRRLSWGLDYTGLAEQGGLQEGRSRVTGEFAYFVVYKGLGEFRGVSYCLEFLAPPDIGEGSIFRVDGVAFDGRVVKGAWF